MRKKWFSGAMAFILAAVFLSTSALADGLPKPESKNAEAQKLIDEAWTINKRETTADGYKQCVALMEQADKLDPDNYMILTDLSRYYWNYGNLLPKETEEQQKKLEGIYAKGIEAAEKSIKLNETVGGHYWFAVNKAASLEFSSILSQAAAFPTILKHSDYVGEHGEDYYYGASGRLWSEIVVRVPKAVVKMVGYDVQEVVDDIDASIKKEPRYLHNYVYKARFINTYFDKKDEALSLLDEALQKDADTIFPDEVAANKEAQADARKLWKDIAGKDYPEK